MEVESPLHRIAIMDHGRLIALGTKEDLKKLAAREERILIRETISTTTSLGRSRVSLG